MKRCPWLVPGALVLLLLAGYSGTVEKPAAERSEGTEEAVRLIQSELPSLLTQTFVPGATIALIEGGSVAWRGAFGSKNAATGEPMTLDTVFEAASLSKPVFAYGVMKLVGRGLLDLDKPLVEYIDEASLFEAYPPTRDGDPRYKKITARHVLTHSTGFPNWFRGNRMVINFDPGTRFSYSGEAYSFLAAVVAKITGKTFNDFMAETVLTPLGMEDSSYIWLDKYEKRFSAAHDFAGSRVDRRKAARPTPGASLYTTASDYAKFLVAVLSGRDLTESAWKSMLSPQIDVHAQVGNNNKVLDWGLGIGLHRTEKGLGFWHWGDNGEFQAYFEVLPAEKRGLIIFLNGVNGQAVSRAVTKLALGLIQPAIATAYFDYPSVDSPSLRMLKAYLAGGFEEFARTAEAIQDPGQENAINRLGYALLGSRKREAAIEIFRYNVTRFPKSANTYDSLAEAYLAVGDKAKAVEYYEKALAVDPKFPSALEALKRLKGNEA
jgi:CubicO group peptidase (beta-lactamase class C family)